MNVQLIEAETGSHLWAERFENPVADLFVMQDEIVSRLAYTLNVQLTSAEARRAQGSSHPDAMAFYFQGRALLNKEINLGRLTQARVFLERALLLDPSHIEALYSRAVVDLLTVAGNFEDDPKVYLKAGEATLIKVLSLAPDHAQAHAILGSFYTNTDRVAQGVAEYERALELDRNLAWAYADIGRSKYFIGRSEETEGHVREAFRLSPRAASWVKPRQADPSDVAREWSNHLPKNTKLVYKSRSRGRKFFSLFNVKAGRRQYPRNCTNPSLSWIAA